MKTITHTDVRRGIKALRELKNFTQAHMAEELGLSPKAYSKIENGESRLALKHFLKIAETLEISPSKILAFNDDLLFSPDEILRNKEEDNPVVIQYKEQVEHLKSEILFLRNQIIEMRISSKG